MVARLTWIGLAVVVLGAASGSHPSDGPDANVRIHIGRTAVEVTAILNLVFVDELLGQRRDSEEALQPSEHAAIRKSLEQWFRTKHKVTVDGVEVTPRYRGFAVQEPDSKLVMMFPRFGTRAMTQIRLDMDYPAKAPPREVAIVWGAYPPDASRATAEGVPLVEVTATLTAGATSQEVVFRQSEPEYVWRRPVVDEKDRFLAVPQPAAVPTMSVPLFSLAIVSICLGVGVLFGFAKGWAYVRRPLLFAMPVALVAAFGARHIGRVKIARPFGGGVHLPSPAEARAIFRPLHANIYRAFDYTDPSDVYDALARSVAGDLLDRLYNQVYQSLVLQDQGGALCRVQSVDLLETKVENIGVLDGHTCFHVVARWRVSGRVSHWGHAHERTNEYQARYAVALLEPGWRIADNQVLAQRRVEARPMAPVTEGK